MGDWPPLPQLDGNDSFSDIDITHDNNLDEASKSSSTKSTKRNEIKSNNIPTQSF